MAKTYQTYDERRRARHFKQRRERALQIIAAENQYSKPFRAEVKDADRMDQRETEAQR